MTPEDVAASYDALEASGEAGVDTSDETSDDDPAGEAGAREIGDGRPSQVSRDTGGKL